MSAATTDEPTTAERERAKEAQKVAKAATSKRKSTSSRKAAKADGHKPSGPTTDHPPKRRELLKKAGLSERTELMPAQVKRADSAEAKHVSTRGLADFIMKGTGASGGGKATPRRSREGKLSAREAAIQVLKKASKPLSAKELASRLLKIKPAPITGTYAQANAQKAFYSLVKDGTAKRDKDGNIALANK